MDSEASSTKRILIAEDDDLQGAVLQRVLKGRGYEAEIVTDGLEAVRRLRTGRYDLALLDYRMPEVDGLAAARLLHDFLPHAECPRLIAVTAAAEELCQKQDSTGARTFDAVVSKRLGLPELLSVIDDTLLSAAEDKAAALLARDREAASETRRRYLRAPLAAAPALGMAAAFIVAIGCGIASLRHVDGAVAAAARNVTLTDNAATMMGAVQDAEASQRTYLATGADAQRQTFETDAQRVDWLLASPESLSPDGTPGFGDTEEPQTVIVNRMRTLSDEVQLRRAAAPGAPVQVLSTTAGRDAIEWLRGWASDLVSGSQRALFTGLDAARRNVEFVLVVLAAGILYALWNAGAAVWRRWHVPSPALALAGTGTMAPWRMPPEIQEAPEPAPQLLHEWD